MARRCIGKAMSNAGFITSSAALQPVMATILTLYDRHVILSMMWRIQLGAVWCPKAKISAINARIRAIKASMRQAVKW